jgi:transposase
MGRARVLEEIRIMRFEELLDRYERGALTQGEAGEMLGMSERTFRRWRERYREEGAAGLRDRRVGKPSPRRADASELARAQALYAEMYGDFTVKHFHEKLIEGHSYRLGYTVTRLALQASGLVRKAPRRGAHRRKRPRRPLPGMMLHQDGSTHAWLAGQPPLDLIVTLDDATSEIYSAFLVAEEGTASSFRGLAETIARKGLFCSLYTDRGGHYFHTPIAGGTVSREQPTQVGRALAELGIEHIPAYAPEARGRSERAFRTLQDRLVNELALAGITSVEAANRFLAETYLPAHNLRFAVAATEPGSAFVACPPEACRDVLCRRETRQVGNDNTVAWRGRRLQIPASPLRTHFVRATVRINEYPDGAVAIFWGPHRIADFPPPADEPHELAA